MRRIAFLFAIACLASLSLNTHTAAQEPVLTAAQQAWLDGLVKAKFTSWVGANGFSVKARDYKVFADDVVPVIEHADKLTETEQGALNEIVRLDVPAEGWVNNYAVSKGVYTVGLANGPHNLQLVTRDANGEVVDLDGWYLNNGSDGRPQATVLARNKRVEAAIAWNDIIFHWKFSRRSDHDEQVGAVTEFNSGDVSIFSDMPEEAGIQHIADLAAQAVGVNEELFGRKFPEGEKYQLYLLLGRSRFDNIDGLLTGGNFKDHGAMTSWATGLSYIQWWTHWGEDYRLCSDVLEVVIHELHHQYMYRVFPSFRYAPTWLQESLAEYAAQQGLEKAEPNAGETYRLRRLAEFDFYRHAGMVPTAGDITGDVDWDDISPFYATMWCIGHELAKQPDDMRALVEIAAQCQRMWVSLRRVQKVFDERFPPMSDLLETASERAAESSGGYIKKFGCVDVHDGEVQYNSQPGKGGYALFKKRVAGNTMKFSCEFRWDDSPNPQIDFYLAFTKSAKTEHFLKLAVLPGEITLFRNWQGDWRKMRSFSYDTRLEIMKGDEPVWHSIEINFNAGEESIRVDTTGERQASFKLGRYYTLKDTYAGFGAYNGVAWFRNLKVE